MNSNIMYILLAVLVIVIIGITEKLYKRLHKHNNADPFVNQVKKLLAVNGIPNIYLKEPVRSEPNIKPLTDEQRRAVDAVSKERGWRIFNVEL